MQTGMPTLPLCFQNSSSLHMASFKPNRAGNQEGQVGLTSPLPLFLLSVTPSWGSASLLHCISRQRWDQDTPEPFLASTNLLSVFNGYGKALVGLGLAPDPQIRPGDETPCQEACFALPAYFQPQSSKPSKNSRIRIKLQDIFTQLTRVFSSLFYKWKNWGTERLSKLPKVIELNQFQNSD